MPPLRVERLLPQWATARVDPTAFLGGDSERRVQEAAPYKGRIPPERAGEDTRPYCGCGSILSFRRGRTLAGPREGHTPGWLLSTFGRFTFSPSPANPQENFPDMGRGAPWGSRRELFGPKGHPHPPRIRSAPSPWKGEGFRAADSRPYEFQEIWVGEPLGAPAGIRTSHRLLGKARRGRETAPTIILANPGPSGPAEIGTSHSDFARRKCS